MSRFTVVWHQDAQDQLASIWLDSDERDSITLAANAIDRHLITDATEKGAPVDGGLRQLTIPPLRVLFGVAEQDMIVRIVQVFTV